MVRSARWVTCRFHLCELVCVCTAVFRRRRARRVSCPWARHTWKLMTLTCCWSASSEELLKSGAELQSTLDRCEKTVSPQLVCDSVLVEWITCVNGSLCLFSRVLRKQAEEREHFVLRHRREKKFTTNTGEVTAWKQGVSAQKEKHSQRIFVLVVILFTLNKCTVLCTGSPAFGSCFHNHDTGF